MQRLAGVIKLLKEHGEIRGQLWLRLSVSIREGLPVSQRRRVGAQAKVAHPAPGACSRRGPQVLWLLRGYF